MLSKVLVEMPTSGVVRQKAGKHIYIYRITRAFRGSNGKPTNERVSIGKLDEETGMLIPNRTYYLLYETDTTKDESAIVKVQNKGVTEFLEKAMDKSNLTKMLQKVFPTKYNKLAILAMYMLSEGNVMWHIDNWCEDNATPDDIVIKSQEASRIFASITHDERVKFFKLMAMARVENEFVAYDVTSISSYSKGIESVEWGYNRDKEDLPQINIGMYYGEESKLPLYYMKYPGSINDKAHMSYMIKNNKELGIKNVSFVMDRGFYSKDNIVFLKENNVRFIMAMTNENNVAKELIAKCRDDLMNKSKYRLGKGLPFGTSVETRAFGNRLKVCVYYSSSKASCEIERFLDGLAEYEKVLYKNTENKKSSYRKYFDIVEKNGKNLHIMRKEDEIDEKMKKFGFFLLLTTEHKLNEREILEKYRNKDVVEKSFDNLKNDLDMGRLYCQSEETLDGKLFVAYLALILRAYTWNKLKKYLEDNNMSYTCALKELAKIKEVTLQSQKNQISPLTKKQKELFELI